MSCSLEHVVQVLETLAPLRLAESWDNVGLLLAPSRPRPVERILLTIDLTDAVVEEALAGAAELVVGYHPVIFQPLRRLADQPRLVRLVEAQVAVYSPHTALDAVPGGVNDWLADGVGPGRRRPLQPSAPQLQPPPGAGQGRWVELEEPVPVRTLLQRIRAHLQLQQLRVALSPRHVDPAARLGTVALCPGAGGSVLGQVEADLFLTGEMRHHDVLAAQARGTSVILTDHTHTERGYLPALRGSLHAALEDRVQVRVAADDREPLQLL